MNFSKKMIPFFLRYRWQFFCKILLLLVVFINTLSVPSSSASTQSELESKVKAAYINNFTRFVYWKNQQQSGTKNQIVIGVLGSDNIGEILEDFSKKKNDDQSIIVKKFKKRVSEISDCNLLFIAQSEQQQLSQILKQVEGANVLTVSDIPGFAKRGGMIGFFIEQNRVRIEINIKATNKAGLKISAKLLEVARIIDSEG